MPPERMPDRESQDHLLAFHQCECKFTDIYLVGICLVRWLVRYQHDICASGRLEACFSLDPWPPTDRLPMIPQSTARYCQVLPIPCYSRPPHAIQTINKATSLKLPIEVTHWSYLLKKFFKVARYVSVCYVSEERPWWDGMMRLKKQKFRKHFSWLENGKFIFVAMSCTPIERHSAPSRFCIDNRGVDAFPGER